MFFPRGLLAHRSQLRLDRAGRNLSSAPDRAKDGCLGTYSENVRTMGKLLYIKLRRIPDGLAA
jgi:hypothetical protein